jgi:hypothetical protein
MDEGQSHELFSAEELEESGNFDDIQIENPFNTYFLELNSLINQLKDGTSKTDAEIMQLVVQANTILTKLDKITNKLFNNGLPLSILQPIVMQIMEKKNILDNTIFELTNKNKGGKKRKSKKSKKRKSKKRRRKSMKR